MSRLFLLMILPPPTSTPTHTLFPYPTPFRSPTYSRPNSVYSSPNVPIWWPNSCAPTRSLRSDASMPPVANTNELTRHIGISRSEEHTSELQSLMRISYAVFCLKKKTQQHRTNNRSRIREQS